jgi:tRNA-dihydrouridine synthase A
MPAKINRLFSVAPMLDWTDRHCRYFYRLMSKHALLYTEMVTTGAIIHGDTDRYLEFNNEEHPVALQLGGSNPKELAHCCKVAEDYGYDEINLNVGCPSDRVQSGRFGACLMADPELVRECLEAMQSAVSIDVTVKHRIGIDRADSYDQLAAFVEKVKLSGIKTFIIHARKAWLDGLSPKENRDVPPLRYDAVYAIKQDHPELEIIINGGIGTFEEVKQHLHKVDGAMLGRAIYHNPWLLSEVDRTFFHAEKCCEEPKQVIDEMLPYISSELARGTYLNHITRHMLGMFQGKPGAKAWRRYLSENAHKPDAGIDTVKAAVALVKDV